LNIGHSDSTLRLPSCGSASAKHYHTQIAFVSDILYLITLITVISDYDGNSPSLIFWSSSSSVGSSSSYLKQQRHIFNSQFECILNYASVNVNENEVYPSGGGLRLLLTFGIASSFI
jgi:hypothetical protein